MILSRAPFRLPLGGGGTDLPSYYEKYECFLITAAVNKYMYLTINEPAIVHKIKINYSKVEIVEVDEVDHIKHEIVRETLKHLNIRRPLEISSMADLAAGTGMGSSSSYAVALLKGLNSMLRRFISLEELAEEACKIEIEMIGKPIGKQDQYAASFGGIIQMEIDRSGKVTVSPLSLEHEVIYELENRLMMFYTNIERDANEILADQSQQIKEGANKKAEIPDSGTSNGKEENEKRALMAMHKIKEIGYRVKDTLLEGNVTKFGELLHEHWLTKKMVSQKMSNSCIDKWYELGINNGALGGKIMGAGGGGFLLFCAENGARKYLRKTMESAGLRYMDFRFDFEGAKVLVNM
jgi:D-glycero-alpha-D-manno-heptose-7-phosphate kinase